MRGDDGGVLGKAFYQARERDLEKRLGAKRFEHTKAVAETAAQLARRYGVDERTARLAGLLHDWDKNYDDEGIRRRADEVGAKGDPWVYASMPRLLHGPTAAAALAREFPELPADIVQAIERHTTAAVGMSDLDMVVYIADAIEPHRCFEGIEPLRQAVGNVPLEELFFMTYRHIFESLIARGCELHPATTDIWNYYVARARKAPGGKGTK